MQTITYIYGTTTTVSVPFVVVRHNASLLQSGADLTRADICNKITLTGKSQVGSAYVFYRDGRMRDCYLEWTGESSDMRKVRELEKVSQTVGDLYECRARDARKR